LGKHSKGAPIQELTWISAQCRKLFSAGLVQIIMGKQAIGESLLGLDSHSTEICLVLDLCGRNEEA